MMYKKLIYVVAFILLAGLVSNSSAATLVLDWNLDGDLTDSSGNSYDALYGNATPTADRFGNANSAMDFSNDGDYASGWDYSGGPIGDIPKYATDAFTINVWAKMDAVGPYGTWNSKALAMAGIGDPEDRTESGNNRFIGLEYYAMNQPGTVFFWGEGADYNSMVQPTLGVWHMYTCTYDGAGNVSLYLASYDDTQTTYLGSGTVSLVESKYEVHLSKGSGEGEGAPPYWAYDFRGQMDDFQIWRGVLTKAEIDALVPEPATIALLGLGALGLLWRRKRV
jgi:hypothetical protein